MKDFTRTYEIAVDAPIRTVFDYCRDPRHLFEGWPGLEVTDVHLTPDGVGTTAHIVGTFFKGMMVEQIEREFVEVVPDERIVSTAHATVRMAGRNKEVEHGPVFTWLFESAGTGTTLRFVILEEDLHWWERLSEMISAAAMAKSLHSMLEAIKTGAEGVETG